jgi:hypothetical protein
MHIFWWKLTSVSEVFAASIIKAMMIMTEAENTSETLATFYETTWHYSPEESHLLIHHYPYIFTLFQNNIYC